MDIVGIGTPCVDLLVNVDVMPSDNSGARMRRYSWQGGGKVPTGVVASARLGGRVGMIGVVGSGTYGQFCLVDFERHGIDVSHMVVDEHGETPFAVPISENSSGDRNIIYYPGNLSVLSPDEIDKDYITSARLLHISGASPATMYAAQCAHESGVLVAIDAERYRPDLEELMPFIDVFIGSETCYRNLFDDERYHDHCRELQARGPHIVAFTLGSRGSVGIDGDETFFEESISVPVRDTTGAGDVYHGAFNYGLLQGWETPYVARFSNIVAAIKCTRLGGRAAIPSLETVNRYLENGVIDYTEIDERVAFYRTLQV